MGEQFFRSGNPPAGLSNVVAIGAGDFHSLALRADGAIVAWGDNNYGQTNVPVGLNNVGRSPRDGTTTWRSKATAR